MNPPCGNVFFNPYQKIRSMAITKDKRSFFKSLPVYGCYATGIIYVGIGVIAILSFLKLKDGGADESSLLAFLNDSLVGKIFFWLILLGTVCYVIWRIFETIEDPYEYGNDFKGIAKRSGVAMSAIPDALIVFTAIQILLGAGNIQVDGQPVEQREMVASLMENDWGVEIVIAIGVVVAITAGVQFFYGISRGYKERMEIENLSSTKRKTIHALAWAGYAARGIILGIIGYFFIKAGVERSGQEIVNTDKAFDFIGDHVGHAYFIVVAIGTICYGLFMFAQGMAYDAEKD